jgi:hypothetical protein
MGADMQAMGRAAFRMGIGGLASMATWPAIAAGATYPNMAPVAQYAMASADQEIALARSAAPPSISADADVLVLGAHGYTTAVKGKNGFACLVLRSWTAGLSDPVFWDPNIRGPACLNAAAVQTVLPHVLERAQWVMSGVSKSAMADRIKAQLAAKTFVLPAPGAMCFMMSRQQFLSEDGVHWHPHLMFYVADASDAAWGANLKGSPVIAGHDDPAPVTIFMIPVKKWSDGTPEMMSMK